MSSWTFAAGAFVEGALVPATDRGFRYGMSVFETLAVHQGVPLLVEDHLRRLRAGCQAAGFVFPESLSSLEIEALACGADDGMLRLYVSAGSGGPTEVVADCQTYALFEQTRFPTENEIHAGWRIGMHRAPFPIVLGGWKTGNYWSNIQAMQEAKLAGLNETLVSNAQGAVISASMGNVFVSIGGRILTPARSMGARDGVIRAWVMEEEPVEEALLSMDDLDSIEECFITNSRIGIMPVAAIGEKPLPSCPTGRRLAGMYRERILGTR